MCPGGYTFETLTSSSRVDVCKTADFKKFNLEDFNVEWTCPKGCSGIFGNKQKEREPYCVMPPKTNPCRINGSIFVKSLPHFLG